MDGALALSATKLPESFPMGLLTGPRARPPPQPEEALKPCQPSHYQGRHAPVWHRRLVEYRSGDEAWGVQPPVHRPRHDAGCIIDEVKKRPTSTRSWRRRIPDEFAGGRLPKGLMPSDGLQRRQVEPVPAGSRAPCSRITCLSRARSSRRTPLGCKHAYISSAERDDA